MVHVACFGLLGKIQKRLKREREGERLKRVKGKKRLKRESSNGPRCWLEREGEDDTVYQKRMTF
jgi:hypothetical protein